MCYYCNYRQSLVEARGWNAGGGFKLRPTNIDIFFFIDLTVSISDRLFSPFDFWMQFIPSSDVTRLPWWRPMKLKSNKIGDYYHRFINYLFIKLTITLVSPTLTSWSYANDVRSWILSESHRRIDFHLVRNIEGRFWEVIADGWYKC